MTPNQHGIDEKYLLSFILNDPRMWKRVCEADYGIPDLKFERMDVLYYIDLIS